jgi:hypothetical protein
MRCGQKNRDFRHVASMSIGTCAGPNFIWTLNFFSVHQKTMTFGTGAISKLMSVGVY